MFSTALVLPRKKLLLRDVVNIINTFVIPISTKFFNCYRIILIVIEFLNYF